MSDVTVNVWSSPPPPVLNGVDSSSQYIDPARNPAEFKAAVSDYYSQELGNGLKTMISGQQGIPQAQKETAYAAVDAALSTGTIDTPREAINLSDEIMELVSKMAKENLEEADGEAKSKAGGGGNWLVALAKAMSTIAGKHLEQMVLASEAIGALDSADTASFVAQEGDSTAVKDAKAKGMAEANDSNAKQASEMATLTAKMQAHGQMYKLIQEATTTTIKTVGEALHSTARKQ